MLRNYQETRRQGEISPQSQEAPHFYFASIATNDIPAPLAPPLHSSSLVLERRTKGFQVTCHMGINQSVGGPGRKGANPGGNSRLLHRGGGSEPENTRFHRPTGSRRGP